jgi:uncharacterized protein
MNGIAGDPIARSNQMAESARLANPAPLGLAGFGMTTILLSLINADVLPHTGEK